MRTMRMFRTLGVVAGSVVLTAALSSCGDDSDGDAKRTTSVSVAQSSAVAQQFADACKILTPEQISAATGRQTQPGELSTATNLEPGETRCTWNAADGKRVLLATLYTQPMDAREKFEALRTGLFYDEDAPSPGVGEESFYRLAGHGDLASIVFIDGGSTVHLRLGNPDDTPASTEREAEGREQLVELARDVTSR